MSNILVILNKFIHLNFFLELFYSLSGTILDNPVNVQGILIDGNLTSRPTSCNTGFLKQTYNEFKLLTSLSTLYCALVRSILEFGVVV